jgi:hypothetical protein
MPNKAEIKAAILKAAGNPTVGVIADLADSMAEEILAIDNPPVKVQEKESRVTKPEETR